jgi:dihydroorotase
MNEIILHNPLDMHVHLRQGEMLKLVAPLSAKTFSGVLVMPNTDPPIKTIDQIKVYKEFILSETENFTPYMTLYFDTNYTESFLKEAKEHIIAIKFYPKGATNNSQHGCDPNDFNIAYVLRIMEYLDIPLCIHAEMPDRYHEDREQLFHIYLQSWAFTYPKLKIIIEHISDHRTTILLNHYGNLYGTITPHHLLFTGDDFIGPPLNPYHYCMPVCKKSLDRATLQESVLLNNDKYMLGTDSAPHNIDTKLYAGAPGIFNAPIALQLLAEIFENHLESFQNFISNNAQRIYGIKPLEKQITLIKQPFTIPQYYDDVVPMKAGKQLEWSLK